VFFFQRDRTRGSPQEYAHHILTASVVLELLKVFLCTSTHCAQSTRPLLLPLCIRVISYSRQF